MTKPDEAPTTEVAAAVSGLRELADFIEAHPRFLPAIEVERFHLPVFDPDEFVSLVSELGGERTKNAIGDYFGVSRYFGSIEVYVYTPREKVCEAKVVGTETVEIPDPDAPKIAVERPIIEWECSPVLGVAS